ncbi:hypothetical protein CSUNSWCD_1978 [Campylobacter showae CSUNSWCD]|uniref:Uncharacterized protein n=1 Tax=Campylobacter showae CSUNSWCD TaxID=1244083 RepID=M5IFX8_9BACT|nr:hypothetical protein CSUNSWCD_1978 [Campylobacter showae CSUNSWCD]
MFALARLDGGCFCCHCLRDQIGPQIYALRKAANLTIAKFNGKF